MKGKLTARTLLFPYYCFAVSRLSSVVGITSSNRILSGINLYLCLQYMDGNAQPLLGETLRGKGGNPHFCYGFRVPPFPLSFIPLTPAGSRTGHKRLTLWNKVILTYHSVGSRTGHKRLTRRNKVSLHTIPQAVGQVTNGPPCGTKHPSNAPIPPSPNTTILLHFRTYYNDKKP